MEVLKFTDYVTAALLALLLFSIIYPLYRWYIRKDRDSKIYKITRAIRAVFGAGFAVFAFTEILSGQYKGSVGAPIVLAYLLMKKWCVPKKPDVDG